MSKLCSVSGCARPYRAKGYCHSHYWKFNYHELNSTWQNMMQRCNNRDSTSYKNYGGRGIRVCDRWQLDFANFLEDMGERPLGTTLDRIDNNGNYEPGNCKWSTKSEQLFNTRLNCRNKSGYRGISWDKSRNKWRASIKIHGKEISARFNTEQEAIEARTQWYDEVIDKSSATVLPLEAASLDINRNEEEF